MVQIHRSGPSASLPLVSLPVMVRPPSRPDSRSRTSWATCVSTSLGVLPSCRVLPISCGQLFILALLLLPPSAHSPIRGRAALLARLALLPLVLRQPRTPNRTTGALRYRAV